MGQPDRTMRATGSARVLLVLSSALVALVGLLGSPASSWSVEAPDVTITQTSSSIRVATGHVVAELRRSPLRLTVRDLATRRRVLRGGRGGVAFYQRAGVVHELGSIVGVTSLADGVALVVTTDEGVPAGLTLRFLTRRTLEIAFDPPTPATLEAIGGRIDSARRETIYGLTERLRDSPSIAPGVIDIPIDDVNPPEVGSLNRRGERVEMRVLPTFSLYAPFYQSSAGYGLAVDGTQVGVFDVAQGDARTISFRFEAGSVPDAQRLVFAVHVGAEPPTVLDEYTNRVGRPIVPPDWAFLHWRWRGELAPSSGMLDGISVNGQLADDVNMYDALGIPAGVYVFDRPVLAGNFGFARWEWDTVRLPNIDLALGSMRARGYRLMTWSSCWTCGGGASDHGTEAQSLGYHVPGVAGPSNCADLGGVKFVLDVTNPAARDWWRDKITDFFVTWDLDGIKLDRGEEHIPETAALWANGRPGRENRNAYPTLQARVHHDALLAARPTGDFLLVARAGYTGTSHWSTVWGGDIPGSTSFGSGPGTDLGLRSAIISQQRAADMGYPIWGSDTGGYYQFKDREVFARWLEFSAFSGIMEIGGVGTHAPWDMPTSPAYDTELIDIYRRYVQVRHALQPYLVAVAAQAAGGTPMVRPMRYADPRDRRLADRWDQFLLGADLLVAPVWKVGQRSRTVYLPRGTWRNWWDPAQVFQGPRTLTVDVALDAIPVFVRDGAGVPQPPP